MNKHELAKSLRSGIFADRDTLQEAYEYVENIAKSCGSENTIYILTAIHVLMNTIANEIAKIEE